VSDRRPASPRGSMILYAAAFVAMLGAGLFLVLAALAAGMLAASLFFPTRRAVRTVAA